MLHIVLVFLVPYALSIFIPMSVITDWGNPIRVRHGTIDLFLLRSVGIRAPVCHTFRMGRGRMLPCKAPQSESYHCLGERKPWSYPLNPSPHTTSRSQFPPPIERRLLAIRPTRQPSTQL